MYKKIIRVMGISLVSVGVVFGSISSVAAEEVATYESDANVRFEENTDITPPVDPTDPNPTEPVTPNPDEDQDPDQEVDAGTPGPLSIDYASHFNFGTVKKTGNAATYEAKPITITLPNGNTKEVAPYVQVTDNRGNKAGWTLSVSQDGQLTNQETNKELAGAAITLNKGIVTSTTDTNGVSSTESVTLDPENANTAPILEASEGNGAGTFVNSFGSAEDMGVSLFIPAGTEIDDGHYQTTINWMLEDTP